MISRCGTALGQIEEIWSLCFGTEDDYFRHFADSLLDSARTCMAVLFADDADAPSFFSARNREDYQRISSELERRGGIVATTLQMIPIELLVTGISDRSARSFHGSYLYGVATRPEFRGRGYASYTIRRSILEEAEEKSYFIVGRPAEQGLFDYYRKLGLTFELFRNPDKLPWFEKLDEVHKRGLNASKLHSLRENYWGRRDQVLPSPEPVSSFPGVYKNTRPSCQTNGPTAFFDWDEKTLAYILSLPDDSAPEPDDPTCPYALLNPLFPRESIPDSILKNAVFSFPME